jgi:hypothetical protein
MTWWQAHDWADWVRIFESQSEEWLGRWRWQLYDLASESPVGSAARNFARDALSQIGQIERRRALHGLLREQLLTRPDLSADVLLDALVLIERMRLDFDGAGGFEDDFAAAIEVAEVRAETVRAERNGS